MRPFVIIFCLVLLLGAGISIYKFLVPAGIPYDGTLDRCIGERLGQQALKLASGTDEIVLFTLDEKQAKNPVCAALLQGLRQSLQPAPSIQLAVEFPADTSSSSECLSAPDLADILAKHPNAKVIISFLGVPCGRLPTSSPMPKIVSLSRSPTLDWGSLFAAESITAVIWPRPQYINPSQPTGTDECSKLFAASYVIVTRDNFHELEFDKIPSAPVRQR